MNCKRCGKCCHRGDFWYLSEHPLIKRLHLEARPQLDDGRCALLNTDNECMIEKYLGRDAKPDVCKEYDCEAENEPTNKP